MKYVYSQKTFNILRFSVGFECQKKECHNKNKYIGIVYKGFFCHAFIIFDTLTNVLKNRHQIDPNQIQL